MAHRRFPRANTWCTPFSVSLRGCLAMLLLAHRQPTSPHLNAACPRLPKPLSTGPVALYLNRVCPPLPKRGQTPFRLGRGGQAVTAGEGQSAGRAGGAAGGVRSRGGGGFFPPPADSG